MDTIIYLLMTKNNMVEDIIYSSSMFDAIVWQGSLIVQFKSNQTIYIYKELSPETIVEFTEAESHGKYFIANIQKTATFEKTEFMTFEEAIESL